MASWFDKLFRDEYDRVIDEYARIVTEGNGTGAPRGILNNPDMHIHTNVIEGHCWESTPDEIARGNSTPTPPVPRPERPVDPFPYWSAERRPTVDLRRFQMEGLAVSPEHIKRFYPTKGA